MLRSFAHLRGFTIQASDGEIGSLRDVYFDDRSTLVRYFVVDTGTWLPGRRVLLAADRGERDRGGAEHHHEARDADGEAEWPGAAHHATHEQAHAEDEDNARGDRAAATRRSAI